ncbi:hypothetical protein Apa02nite_062030 [Actinoplanes palleronii]|uniref:Transposase n=1 Tax=Actinoplanes palleronii TaxID=113570 RepID=A0ABQ4BHJ4_9ACTN|nr:hypothetical protein Apa02nite_062030 [Actinoplanes palleronii]
MAGLGDTPVGVRGEVGVSVQAVAMADPVGARRPTEDEGRRLQQIVRRQTGSSIRLRRAIVIMASARGNTVAAIAQLVQGDQDAIRELIHRFNEIGLACLDPQ